MDDWKRVATVLVTSLTLVSARATLASAEPGPNPVEDAVGQEVDDAPDNDVPEPADDDAHDTDED